MRTEDLTAGQLITAAWDLHNAALVVKHAAYFKGSLVDRETGAVCMVGAIELATYKELAHYPGDQAGYAPTWFANIQHTYVESGTLRAECAITVLADFVPNGLCVHCDDELIAQHCDCFPHCAEPREAWEIATHYNDRHCQGGTMAVNVLNLAADHAEELGMTKKRRIQAIDDFLRRERVGV